LTEFKIMFTLDVGCGDNPSGDVNVDLFIADYERHRTPLDGVGTFNLDAKKISNFVLADAHFLPFKSGVFDLVISRQLIEHVKSPMKVLCEFTRVTRHQIIIECPHRLGDRIQAKTRVAKKWNREHHINALSFKYFLAASHVLNLDLKRTETLSEVYFPNSVFRLLTFPYVIRITLQKQQSAHQN
jgi:ubiquinone/menaquinone biosynthesis C-methylase UbiE